MSAAPETVSLRYQPADTPAPVIRRIWDVDWDEFFGQLVKTTHLVMPVPGGVTLQKLRESIRAAAIRRGMNVRCHAVGDDLYVSIRHTRPRTRSSERNKEIVAALDAGETMEAVGHRYSLSRQRIEQIKIQNFAHLPPGRMRTDAAIEFLGPYLPFITQRFCAVCGDEIPNNKGKKGHATIWLCAPCRQLQRIINKIKGCLAGWSRGDTPTAQQQRNQAIHMIRKHNIKPEHLAGRKKEATA